jgi:hypothetical protein
LGSVKDLSIHRDRQRKATSLFTYYGYDDMKLDGRWEELDGRAVSALGVRSRKLSTCRNGQS